MISVIIPVFNESDNLDLLHNEISEMRKVFFKELEVIFVDDGSTDSTNEVLKKIVEKDGIVKLVALNKNYGQTTAIAAGIKHSKGEIIVTLDADLQNDPKDIPKLIEFIDKGFDVVSGWRKERKDSFFSRVLPSKIANSIISFITGVKLHDFGCTLKAYKREYIENLSLHGEMHRFLPAYCAWQGAKIAEIPVNHRSRIHGVSKYGIERIFKVILDLLVAKFILSYMSKPIYIFGGISLISFFAGLFVFVFVVYRKIYMLGEWISPLFFVAMLLWTLGVICLLMGLLAEVLLMVYQTARRQELYKIKWN